jgi:hypothetical protein
VATDSPLLPISVLQLSTATTSTALTSTYDLHHLAMRLCFLASSSYDALCCPDSLTYRCHSDYPRAVCWGPGDTLVSGGWDRSLVVTATLV